MTFDLKNKVYRNWRQHIPNNKPNLCIEIQLAEADTVNIHLIKRQYIIYAGGMTGVKSPI